MMYRLFHFHVDKDAATGIAGGVLMLFLSAAMNIFPDSEIAQILLRDVFMIFLLGFVFPLYYMILRKKEDLSSLGIHKKKLKSSLLINVVLALALLAMFIKGNSEPVRFTLRSFYAITYILAAGIFEMVFIYGFLRCELERAFGIIPAVILTAFFYSLHHAGFQPEFLKLFQVGLMYVAVFYITRNIFIIFPFFWGAGAIWDVLVNSDAGRAIENQASFVIAIALLVGMVITTVLVYRTQPSFTN